MQTNYRNTLLDPHWVVAIQEEIAANPMGIAFSVEPALMGRYDAEQGNACQPVERGYRTLGDLEAYCAAYRDATERWAAQVQEINNTLGVDVEAELEDLIEGMMDNEFWRTGGR